MFSDKHQGENRGWDENFSQTGLNTFPERGHSAYEEKVYKPEAFADQHTADLVRENKELRSKVTVMFTELF